MRIWQMLALVGTVIFVFSAAFPMVSVYLVVPFSIRLLDVYGWFGHEQFILENGSELKQSFSTMEAGLLLAAILYPLTIVIGFVSALTCSKVSLAAGVMGMVLWLGSIYAILTLKSTISQMARPFGSIASSFVQIGYGVYVGILGSAILLVSHLSAFWETKKGSPENPVEVLDTI